MWRMPSGRWSLQPVYEAARRAAPLAYLAIAWPEFPAAAAAVLLLALENTLLRRFHTPAVLLHYAVASLLPPPQAFALAVALIPLLHWAKVADNYLSWRGHAVIFTAAALLKPQLLPALVYTLAEAAWYLAKYAKTRPRVEGPPKIDAVAGAPLSYRLKIATGAPAVVRLPDGREVEALDGEVEVEVKTRFDAAGLYTPEVQVVYANPTRTVRFRKAVRHPPIYVAPRYRRAVELGEKIIAGAVEEVAGAREYVPGDPLRRLHWKKMAKIQKPVVKLLEGRAAGGLKIAVLLYATSPKALDRVLEATASATATALARSDRVEIYAVTRRGGEKIAAERRTYREAVERLVSLAEVLHVEAAAALDYADALPKADPPPADVVIGEAAFVKPLCRRGAICLAI